MILSSLSPPFRTLLTMPNALIWNSMACRVFRHLKLGILVDYNTVTSTGTTGTTSVNVPLRSLTFNVSHDPDGAMKTEVKKTMEWESRDTSDGMSNMKSIVNDANDAV
jgi:hypothetical protein